MTLLTQRVRSCGATEHLKPLISAPFLLDAMVLVPSITASDPVNFGTIFLYYI